MAAHTEGGPEVVISGDAARSGVTGHNVRYVLVFGMTGVIAAFALVAFSMGFGSVTERASAALARSPYEIAQALAPYAALVFAGAVLAGLLLGIWSLIAGRTENDTQAFMRARVVAQFAMICVIMAIFSMSTG